MQVPPVQASHCSYPVREGNRVTPLVDSYHFYERIGQVITQAKHSLWIVVSFISQSNRIPVNGKLVPIWDVLDEAVSRNLDVRVLFWRNPSFTYGNKNIFHGTEADFEQLQRRRSTFLARWDDSKDNDHCHHEKTWLIDAGHDSELVFTGGIVLSGGLSTKGHEPSSMAHNQIHDIMLEIAGPACTDVHHSFVQRWNEANGHNSPTGCWPNLVCAKDLSFPLSLVHRNQPIGEAYVQIQRTIRKNGYSIGFPPPGGHVFNIKDGEASIYEQYKAAIQSAQDTIYIENQHIAHDYLIDLLMEAMKRGVMVFFLVPGQGIGAAVAVRHQTEIWKNKYSGHPEGAPPPPRYASVFLDKLPALKKFPNFCLAALVHNGAQGRSHVYVHSKLMIVDNKWFTVGSANFVDISFDKDHTELNASVWNEHVARNLLHQLLAEHTGQDLRNMSSKEALWHCKQMATENLARLQTGQPTNGNLYAVDPATYCLPVPF